MNPLFKTVGVSQATKDLLDATEDFLSAGAGTARGRIRAPLDWLGNSCRWESGFIRRLDQVIPLSEGPFFVAAALLRRRKATEHARRVPEHGRECILTN